MLTIYFFLPNIEDILMPTRFKKTLLTTGLFEPVVRANYNKTS